MSSEHSAMAKVRGRIRRETEAVEDAEIEGGELNLVPYMDILVNTIIFLLATMTSGLTLANINVDAPRYSAPGEGASEDANPDEKPKLNLTVAISEKGYVVAGSGGVITDQAGSNISVKCKSALRNGRCPATLGTRPGPDGKQELAWIDSYDYAGLEKMMKKVKSNYSHERQVILTADRHIPYKVVVQTMDTLRGKPSDDCTGEDGCLFDQVVLSAGVQ